MAHMIPATIGNDATRGEKQLFELFKNHLPDSWYVYFNIPVGGKYSDFIIIGPDLGLVVIEVKDWTIRTVRASAKDNFTINVPDGTVVVDNPLNQARKYVFTIIDEIKRKKASSLLKRDTKNNGKLAVPYTYLVAFPNISESQSMDLGFGSIFERSQLLLQSDCAPQRNTEGSLQKLVSSNMPFKVKFTDEQYKSLQDTIYISNAPAVHKTLVMQLDENQRNYAKHIGAGHRLINGVAGSGKTVICAYRANLLAALNRNWKILVLCYTKTLVHYISHTIEQTQDEYYPPKSPIEVTNFHAWCSDLIRQGGENLRKLYSQTEEGDYDLMMKDIIEKLLEEGKIRTAQYDAIIVDEAQDFEPWWFKLVATMLKPENDNLLICYDKAQKIYLNNFTWKGCGINAVGHRTHTLKVNYRNTMEIAEFAENVCFGGGDTADTGKEGDLLISEKLRHGQSPVIVRADTLKGQAEYIAETIKDLLAYDICKPDEIACVYINKSIVDPLLSTLQEHSIPHLHVTKSGSTKSSPFLFDNKVDVLTIHSAKGLEYKTLFLYGADYFDDDEQGLAYVAMTRAQELLYITHSKSTYMTKIMYDVLGEKIITNKLSG